MTRDDVRAFYADPRVRARIEEYMGAGAGQTGGCVYLAQPDHHGWPRLDCARRPEELDTLLDCGADLSRSLWDRGTLIAHLDIEYVNFDFPREAYHDPVRSFRVQRPVCEALERILHRYGIQPLHMISGRGHHYVWCLDTERAAFHELARLGRCHETLSGRYRHTGIPFAASVPEPLGKAFAGLGLLMEYLAGEVKRKAALATELPVELTDVTVGPVERGREMISLDISEYGDPLYLRVARVPFTAYLKPGADTIPQTLHGAGGLLTTLAPPDVALEEAIGGMRNLKAAATLAAHTSATIPDATDGTARLLAAYRSSALCAFHDAFHAGIQHPPDRWQPTYDQFSLESLPPCAAHALAEPNDLLLTPAALQLVVRVLLAKGWQTRHIAGLIRSRYERDYGWCSQWLIHDAATRSDFYTRLFAGLFFSGVDDLVDFNCRSIQEKGLCRHPGGGECDILELRATLQERRDHD